MPRHAGQGPTVIHPNLQVQRHEVAALGTEHGVSHGRGRVELEVILFQLILFQLTLRHAIDL